MIVSDFLFSVSCLVVCLATNSNSNSIGSDYRNDGGCVMLQV